MATEQGRLLSPATVQRVLAATSSFFDWAIAAEQYTTGENPMQRRIDHALGRVPERHQPFDDATARRWPREIERHEATKRRLEQLLHDLA